MDNEKLNDYEKCIMRIYREPTFSVAFGDNAESIDPTDRPKFEKYTSETILRETPFVLFANELKIKSFAKSKQVHGVDGLMFNSSDDLPLPYAVPADYLITNIPGIGLAIDTADCNPVVIYDTKQHIAAIAHAGWRGVANAIVPKVIRHLKNLVNTNPRDLKVFIGPSAGVCCYEFGNDALSYFFSFDYYAEVISQFQDKIHIDLVACLIKQLQEMGVCFSSINLDYNLCTICNGQFASYRRDKENSRRMLTVIALNV